MRYDKDFAFIVDHPEWYIYVFEKDRAYAPTEKAPPEAVRAIERINERKRKGLST